VGMCLSEVSNFNTCTNLEGTGVLHIVIACNHAQEVRFSCSIFSKDCDAISKEDFEIKGFRQYFT
jgi:hypothetical protein